LENKHENKQIKHEKQSIKETRDNTDKSNVENKPSTSEIGGRKGPEPTRYGDWEKNGRCIDF